MREHTNSNVLIDTLKHQINECKLSLEAYTVLDNERECVSIKIQIAQAKIKLLVLSGDLTE